MKKSINKFEFFILLEPYIEDLELYSPLIELILNAPLKKYDKLSIEDIKEELKIVLTEDDLKKIKEIVHVLSKPEYGYKISLQIDNKKYINELYERDNKITEYLFDTKGQFSVESPLSHNEKISNYLKLLDISEYQLDYTQSKHVFSYDEYVVLNLAFALEKLSHSIGIVGNDTFIHFTTEDILNEFKERDHNVIEGLAILFRDEDILDESIDIPKQVSSLLKKGYLTKIEEDKLTIGTKASHLFENLFMLNTIQFSCSNMKFIENEEALINYYMFKCTKKSSFFFYFDKGNIIAKIIPDKETLKNIFFKSFEFVESK